MLFLLELATLFFIGATAVYAIYFILVARTHEKKKYLKKLDSLIESQIAPDDLPVVTVLIPTYNEAEVISQKMRNIAELHYPRGKLKVLLVDDDSTDRTREIVQKAFVDCGIDGTVIHKKERTGVNTSYNQAFEQIRTEYVLTTDADAIIPTESLLKAVKILVRERELGGIAAKMMPLNDNRTPATRAAVAYSDSYNAMLEAESSISSTFPGSTSCMLIRRAAFSPMPSSRGSSDGNISLSVIRNGFRFISTPQIVYYEPLAQRMVEQRRQKVRRAARLIQSTLMNADMLFASKYEEFGRKIFPLRFLMMTACPVLFFASLVLFIVFAFLTSVSIGAVLLLLMLALLLIGTKTNIKSFNLVTSFALHQVYLIIGLVLSFKSMSTWRKISRKDAVSIA